MNEKISKAILSGLGLASLTAEAFRKSAEDFVNNSKLSEDEGRRLVKEFQKRSKQAQKGLEKKVNKVVHSVLSKIDPETLSATLKGAKASGKGRSKRRRRAAAGKAGE